MLLVAQVREDKCKPVDPGKTGLEKLHQERSVIPAVTHVDNSARVQTIDPERFPRYHRIVKSFKEKTGCPVVINTSFNVRGEPIVCTPTDAYRCFMATHMDALVIEGFVLLKEDQPDFEIDREAYLSKFELD